MKAAALALAILAAAAPAPAQAPVSGYVSVQLDAVGRPGGAGAGRSADLESRARVFLEHRRDLGDHVRLRLSGYADGLLADRRQPDSLSTDVVVRPQELYVEFISERADLRVGYSRLVWGRLDELQPTDVVNPIDLARFFFEGRAEARLPVAMARARVFLPASTTLEAVVVPLFRPGRFDQLDEPTSTFNLLASAPLPGPGRSREPRAGWGSLQGGVRVQTTSGRVDWGVQGYRGFETFGVLRVAPGAAGVEQVFPRFSMVGGDFETVRGEWGVRGEVAAFVHDSFQGLGVPSVLEGRSFEGGVGADRKAGDFRMSGDVLVRRRFVEAGPAAGLNRTDVQVIGSLDRSFTRETRRLQVFGVYDPTEGTSFLRGIVTVSLSDRLSVEASAGLFSGSGADTLGRFAERDFAYVKIKRHF